MQSHLSAPEPGALCPLPLQKLYEHERQQPQAIYLRQAMNGQWRDYSWGEVAACARRLAGFLRGQNLAHGSRVAIYAGNSPAWFMVDFAIQMAGLVSVPLYPGQAAAAMRYILEHSECQLIFTDATPSDGQFAQALAGLNLPRVAMADNPGEVSLATIFRAVEPIADSPLPAADSLFTLMYTSGTTGNPKGVMHHYRNVAWAVTSMLADYNLQGIPRFFSYLPLAHTGERVLVLLYSLYAGGSVAFPENLQTFNQDLQRARPTFFFSVPRLWQKYKEAIEADIAPAQIAAMLADPRQAPRIRQQVQRRLGLESAEILITGSAPTPEETQAWYLQLGMVLRNGYGMTENCIHGCICRHGLPTVGSVGKPFSGAAVRIGANDEILFQTPALMSGYYREPEKTAEVLRDGWYYTGDTGFIDAEGDLHVTGRVSEVFKTSKGKFVNPVELENRLAEILLLGQKCVIGHGRDAPVLLAGLSASGAGIARTEAERALSGQLARINQSLPPAAQIRQIFVVCDEWTIAAELLTPTMKLRRKAIEARYRGWVDANPDAAIVWES